MLDVKAIGNRIKDLRKERGLSQGAFAEALGVSFQAVSGWERGIAAPDLENLMKIAAFFGVLTDDLLRPREEAVFLGIDGGGTKTEF
ncbi:MAG: helix-turn-helix transcriptional regulator, partial [Clostridia bacterium]|nr:helix-turn-helix transcriptional regulator [Clostridia bacterium]